MTASLGITVSDTVRSGIRIVMAGVACPTCGQSIEGGVSAAWVAKSAGVSAATLSRFLGGKQVTSDVLDRLYEWVVPRLPEREP